MTTDLIRYDLLVQDALKGVVRKILADAVKAGLPGDHHFYISFRTDHPGVRLSQRLRERYPQDMTVVIQHQYRDLGVTEHAFEVGLSFSGIPERLLVPFDAMTGFFDPSVQFGLKFELNETAPAEAVPETPVRPIRGAGSEPAEAQPKRPTVPVMAKPATPKLPAKTGETRLAEVKAKADPAEGAADAKADDAAGAEVVSLDAFRKKN